MIDPSPSAADIPARRPLLRLCAVYAGLALLVMAVSARLWLQAPLTLTRFEFDYFLGLFDAAEAVEPVHALLAGRLIHFGALLGLGVLYLALVQRLWRAPQSLSTRQVAGHVAGLALVFAVGMPWVSPDVFYYIGTGWLEWHHGLNPYRDTIRALPGFAGDPMFANIYPNFLGGVTPYGPLFQKLAAGVALLSGGNETLALALFKVVFLAAHGGACVLVYQLAPRPWRRVALFAYGANPLILFSVLTCAHNDHLTNLAVLAALWLLRRQTFFAAGLALGVAFSFKYFPVVFLPAFLLAAWHQTTSRDGAWLRALQLLAGFLLIALAAQLLYPGSVDKFARMAGSGFDVYRNSIHHLLQALIPGAEQWRGDLGRVLQRLFIGVYPLLLLMYWRRIRARPFEGCVQLCLATTLVYFLLVNACNQEWYLTWLMGLVFVQEPGAAWRLGLRLSAYFLPLVIFTVKSAPEVVLLANVALYLLLAAVGLGYFWQGWRRESMPA